MNNPCIKRSAKNILMIFSNREKH